MAQPKIKAPRSEKTKAKTARAKPKKAKKAGKRNAGGEPKKHALKMRAEADTLRDFESRIAEGKDHKRGNIGPSGQGPHRGRERRNIQSSASERPDVASAGGRFERKTKPNQRHGAATR